MLELLRQPWPWYTSGAAIAFIMVLLLIFGKSFGFSSNLRTLCTLAGAGKRHQFFDFDWKTQKWNLLFLLGAVLGGVIAATLLKSEIPMALSQSTIDDLAKLNIIFDGQLNPSQLFGYQLISSSKGIVILLAGGALVGFGSRYAGGCTSGHAISGLSNLQLPSLLAVIGFFTGGLVMTHFLLPLIF
ncbi:YeeE/YedE family protein [Pedobacter panaciterrae]|jgi:Predicted transporter component|uniref:YeeE/YedE thiosulfate transporter family protein n=1 Tax=Pedobacter panaciterrae TaxID=363849 RepID=A0ABU8NMC0_9SPHI|nr:YeeE/YedE thiosulfate transporter family protein [Pedobacter panaciterrae]NQX52996.1 YeeE/YedE family protein [Pedobacter panaciterrae]